MLWLATPEDCQDTNKFSANRKKRFCSHFKFISQWEEVLFSEEMKKMGKMKNGKNALYRRPILLLVSVKMIASLGGGGVRKAFGPVSLILLWLLKSKGTYKNPVLFEEKSRGSLPGCVVYFSRSTHHWFHRLWVGHELKAFVSRHNLNEYNGLINYFT